MATEEAVKIARILDNAHANGKDNGTQMRDIQLVAIYFADKIKENGGLKEILQLSKLSDGLQTKLADAIKLKGYVKLTEEGHKVIRKALLDS